MKKDDITKNESLKWETRNDPLKKKDLNNQKRVTFSTDPPTVIRDASSPSTLLSSCDTENSKSVSEVCAEENNNVSLNKGETKQIMNCKKCKQKKQFNIRMRLFSDKDGCTEKKSIFDVFLGWFGKIL